MEFTKHYLTYQEYQDLGGATLGETPFNILELEARKNIDKYTTGKLMDLDDQINEVKICMYMLINEINSYNNLSVSNDGSKIVTSENTDGYSVSYLTANESTLKANVERIKTIIKTYLAECRLEDGTPYLYVGVEK